MSTRIVPAILNLFQALQTLGLSDSIKLSLPQATSVVSNSYPPSFATSDPYLFSAILPLLQFLYESRSSFMVNMYPYFSYANNENRVSLDYTLFKSENAIGDGVLRYCNLFNTSVDTFVYAMEKTGFERVPVVVTETGWPTSGGEAVNAENALVYNTNVVRQTMNIVGMPRRPMEGPEIYLFDLFNENEKGREVREAFWDGWS